MKPLDIKIMRQGLQSGRVEWRKHILQKLAERGVPQSGVLEVLLSGEKVRDYADDKPFPSALFLGYIGGRPLHVVAACDEGHERVYVITAYEPSLEIFEADYRTKRKI